MFIILNVIVSSKECHFFRFLWIFLPSIPMHCWILRDTLSMKLCISLWPTLSQYDTISLVISSIFLIFVQDSTLFHWKCYMNCTNLHWPYILLTCICGTSTSGYLLDISSNRLFKAVRVGEPSETRNRPFLKVKFANKGIYALNLSNMLNQKSVQSKIPPYFQYKVSPCISYTFCSYNRSVASKIFNYKASLQQIDFQCLSQNPTPCSCCDSEFLNAPCGHIVTDDLSIVELLKWLFNVTINDISVIYVTAHRCAGGLKKKFDLRSGSQRHRHFVGFFNVSVLAPTRDQPFYTVIPTHRPI